MLLAEDHEDDSYVKDLLFRIAGIKTKTVLRNPPVARLYEDALKFEEDTYITSSGALACSSGEKTGRCPKDKRIVDEEPSRDDIWWGPVNMKCSERTFDVNRERAVDYINTRPRVYVFDGFAGWDPKYRIKVRVISARAYHCVFMHNMLIRPTDEELEIFGVPDFTIINAGEFPANKYTESMSSQTTVSISFARKEMVILGTQYAGEMKKGIFSVMHYLMPKQGVLSLHASCNVGKDSEDVTLFFGLSGTGKTTLSADIHRHLIGDDEHCWTENGIFNIEGGCYAKCIDLSHKKEPEIYEAIKFGAVLENVVLDAHTREIEFADRSITENTRVAYPIEFIPNALIPCMAGHPKNLVMLTCDAFGILPPVSKLTSAQAMYHFISGYTAKIPGTEMGVTDPVPNFSTCFGQPFIVFHPAKYAEMLADKMHAHEADAWLINTGWTGGKYGVGQRCPLKYTRAILDAIHSGELAKATYEVTPIFNLHVPTRCTDVPDEILHPEKAWISSQSLTYDEAVRHLALLFQQNFTKYQDKTTADVVAAGPVL